MEEDEEREGVKRRGKRGRSEKCRKNSKSNSTRFSQRKDTAAMVIE
jgi:hypothetical protein